MVNCFAVILVILQVTWSTEYHKLILPVSIYYLGLLSQIRFTLEKGFFFLQDKNEDDIQQAIWLE